MISIKDLKANGLTSTEGESFQLPEQFLAVLPDECECGADLMISETLTMVSCSNPRCINKVVQRTVDMLAYLGVLNMGAAKCKDFFRRIPVYNPYILFAVKPVDYPKFDGVFSREFMQKIFGQLEQHRDFTLAEFVKIGFLPGIQDSAFRIFKDYTNLTDFYADLEEQGTKMIADLLKLTPESKTVLDTHATLLLYKPDLLQGEAYVNIKQSVKTINICISTAVGAPFTSKAAYVAYMNSTYADKVHLNFLNSVTKACEYLIIADKNGTTNKANAARKNGIPLLTGAEFEELVKNL